MPLKVVPHIRSIVVHHFLWPLNVRYQIEDNIEYLTEPFGPVNGRTKEHTRFLNDRCPMQGSLCMFNGLIQTFSPIIACRIKYVSLLPFLNELRVPVFSAHILYASVGLV